jgi:hypothetical protein
MVEVRVEGEARKMHHIWMIENNIWCRMMMATTRFDDYPRDIAAL